MGAPPLSSDGPLYRGSVGVAPPTENGPAGTPPLSPEGPLYRGPIGEGAESDKGDEMRERAGPAEQPRADPEPEPNEGYVVSISPAGFRRLHYLGACYRVPGLHYLQFEILGPDLPDVAAYHDFCHQCWGAGSPGLAGLGAAPQGTAAAVSSPDTTDVEGSDANDP